jgi:hypothetical protein
MPGHIFNLDETGVSNVAAEPGVKLGQAVLAEGGTLITTFAVVSASRSTVPLMFIFPRAHIHYSLVKGAPGAILGLNNPKSGWMA